MLALLRDPVWQFIGAVVAIIAIVVAVVMTLRQRRQKRLTYSLRTYLLATVRGELTTRVSILYDGQPVRDVRLVEVQIKNAGNLPIATHDFERPLRIAFNGQSKVLTAEITEQTPSDLSPAIDPAWNQGLPEVLVEPLLMNPSDSFTLKLLVAGSDQYEVSARILGVRSLEIERPRLRYTNFGLPIYVAAGISGALLGAMAMRKIASTEIQDRVLLISAIAGLAYGAVSYFLRRRTP